MAFTGTSSNRTNRATTGVLANDNQGGRKEVEFETKIVWAAETNPVAPCFYVPAGFKPSQCIVNSDALSASAGVGLAADLGDSGDTDRLAAALDLDAASYNTKLRTDTGVGYVYTADTLINLTVTGVPIVSTVTQVIVRGTVPY
jgi:hypothetical protein